MFYNLVNTLQLTLPDLLSIFQKTTQIKNNVDHYFKPNNKILGLLFFEPSTRTCCSFQTAMYKLGGNVIILNIDHSSLQKGESLQDCIKTMETYCDILVIRHPQKGILEEILQISTKPIINAGDGNGEHCTQALLDLYTIYSNFGSKKLIITFVGDLKNSRVIHSLVKLLRFYDVEINYVAPVELQIPIEIINKDVQFFDSELTNQILEKTDVLYVCRIQKERFTDIEDYKKFKKSYCITPTLLKKCKSDMILMHPFPRVNEISIDCDDDPRAFYFKQMENGIYVRMAILSLLLNKY